MFTRIFFTLLLLLSITQLVLAHDTWIEKRNGELLVLHGHGGTAEPYDPGKVKEPKALNAGGQAVGMEIVKNKENASLSAKGNPAIIGVFYDSGYWLKTTDGWKQATKREGAGKYTIVESIKSEQYCKSLPAPSAECLKPVGQRFEIVPQKDPATLRSGDKIPIQVLFDGKPVEGAEIATGSGHASDKKDPLKTDKDGMATVTIDQPGLQMVKASHRIPLKNDSDADVLSVASTITFVSH